MKCMHSEGDGGVPPRILVIDDNPSVLESFHKILANDPEESSDALEALEAALFRTNPPPRAEQPSFQVDLVQAGKEGHDCVLRACSQGQPYSVAFVDMRMPSGWDGLKTIEELWRVDPKIQVVICTAYADYSWDRIVARLDRSDRLLILRKPFEKIEVLQLACALSDKWKLHRERQTRIEDLEQHVKERTRHLQDEIAVRQRTEEELRRMARARQMVAKCNHVLVHATSETELLHDMCRIMVETGGYRMAWIGYAQHDEVKSVTPIAQAGFDEGYVSSLKVSWAEGELGNGTAGTAIRTGKPRVVKNIRTDPLFPQWRAQAIKRGYESALGLPLLNGTGQVFGSLSIYSTDPDAFNDAEVELLAELADDIAYGITSLRTEAARKLAEDALRLRNRAIESSVNAIVVADFAKPDLPFEYVNPAFERITGYSAAEALGRNGCFLLREDRNQPGLREIRLALREQREGRAVLRNYRKDGGLFWNDLHIAPVRDDAGKVTHFVGVLNDITDAKNYERQLEHQANYDTLTGLANRNLLQDRLKQAIAHANRQNHIVAVLVIDLDHFKFVNDSLGHSAGDELLKTVAERLKSCVREGDTVARLGGDEFVLILPHQTNVEVISKVMRRVVDSISSAPRITEIVQRVLDTVSQTVVLAGREFIVTCSIGLSFYPQDGQDAETLLKNADAAMYRAKELGRNRFCFYTAELNARIEDRLSLQAMLRHALEHEEFLLHYQPKIEPKSGRISGVEALLRWKNPQQGLIPPSKFISALEETGMIVDVGKWVMAKAMSDLKQWSDEGRPAPRIAVNISQIQLGRPDFPAVVEEVLRNSRNGQAGLDLEITESLIMRDTEANISKLREIREMGVHIAIDDFGTGYSSLSYLAKLPVDALKIDRAFISNITTNADDFGIVSSIISLAHSLKLTVVAEGVETKEQVNLLRQLKCDEIQGYYFSKPLPSDEFVRLLESGMTLGS